MHDLLPVKRGIDYILQFAVDALNRIEAELCTATGYATLGLSTFTVLPLISSFLTFVHGISGFQPYQRSKDVRSTINWESAFQKANAFVAQLNLTEKAGMVTGNIFGACDGNIVPIERIGFPGLCLSDGPAAVRPADLVSVFPAGLTAAASWDRDLIYQRGLFLGSRPVARPLGRHPLGGRNWEGFSPDPYLTGLAINATIRGIHDAGVQSCSKHFIGNEQETQRSNSISADGTSIDAISSNIDDRTLHELYLWPFADAVKTGTASVMCSYNRINETYSCENSEVLAGILKDQLGFQGYVMSDWFATHSGVKSINAGLDMTMPGPIDQNSINTGTSYFGGNITEAVNNGSVSMTRLDDMVQRIMTPYNRVTLKLVTMDFLLGLKSPPVMFEVTTQASYAHLVQPGPPFSKTTILHSLSSRPRILEFSVTTPQISLMASHSSIRRFRVDSTSALSILAVAPGQDVTHIPSPPPPDAIKVRAALTGARVQYITSNTQLAANNFISIYPTPDVCLVFLKTFSQEGYDRLSFEADWNSTLVVNNVASRCPNTVVITHSAGINTMPWATHPNVTAILAAHLPGEETGNAIVDILWGDVNPSAKLPYTIPADEADYDIPVVNLTDMTDLNGWQSNFTEGLLIDYRHFDALNITPLYEFGFGLSYTTFNMPSPLVISPYSASKNLPFGHPPIGHFL
ncbi:related to beta-glucosidase 1 precursor [Phialocephala subalpina]|uniref:Probable beta-glucosidase G n=1 Tax=Phialocephala subalpina TaxID=576137 RepID=A0A1L7X9U3_9HELO|nr:related to beta-glucosidase 1 precursor [Phialocephala subalpina]